jgi:hypothetical protein
MRPARHSANVVFPEPLSPMTASDSPRSSEKLTPPSASTPPGNATARSQTSRSSKRLVIARAPSGG